MYILEDVILPKHKKLRAIRKHLKVNQEQVTGGQVDRSLISYIESGKVKLTRSTAEIIAQSLKKIIEEKELDFEIDADYLLADEKQQIEYQLDTFISKLKDYLYTDYIKFEQELINAKEKLNICELSKRKAKIYELGGDYFYNISKFVESNSHYMRALENYIKIGDIKNTALLNTKLGRCALKTERFEESINYNNYALALLKANSIKDLSIETRVLFNNSLANYKIGNYDEALRLINLLSNNYTKISMEKYLDILLLKGNIFTSKKNFEEAIDVFKEILRISNQKSNKKMKAIAYKNIGETYIKTGETKKALDYLEKSLQVGKCLKDSCFIVLVTTCIIDIYINLGDYRKAEEIFKKYKDRYNDVSLIKIYEKFLDVYIGSGDKYIKDSLLQDIIILLQKGIQKKRDIPGIEKLILKLCRYYFDRDINRVKQLLEFIS
ncbi:helix-turn-helix transcriptional regulator [Caldisalinibacter kiritimatiensis]|uniref:Xre family DNA-binding domain and TPR-repeat containing protein n=1 Tax=Caldisalinibacter kiritimatiensis TaxID=1304284 RepID=R1AUF8_9FIRM|nr:helix-turn-helix transcriptional regulator [Caldisalinibacter kiritimatiensis]EOD00798.1 Xre family DNA-binding domain and TPR-repeat containing protein [Caldisalinibacter kiritimatiensis]